MLTGDISVSGADVLASGSVVVEIGDDIILRPFGSFPDAFELQIIFIEQPGSPTTIKNYPGPGNRHIVEIINSIANNTTTNSIPIYVANKDNKKLLLNAASFPIGFGPGGKRIFSYTVLFGGPSK